MKETLNIFSTEIQESHISNIYTKNYHALHTDLSRVTTRLASQSLQSISGS